ncbi:hypothetical protein C8Q73DRAFT_191315 [Cubamyces lactineus]|nr:hypothetical protein C8Q73DRAFT_191315 [Cubamyces lactineus]
MVIVVGFLAVLPLFVSRGNAGESRGTPTDAPGFTLTPGMPGQTPYDPSPTQCVDTCFTNIAVEVGCQDLSNTSCLCSNIKATQVLSKAALCLQQNCHGEFLNTAQYYEEICGQGEPYCSHILIVRRIGSQSPMVKIRPNSARCLACRNASY